MILNIRFIPNSIKRVLLSKRIYIYNNKYIVIYITKYNISNDDILYIYL